MSKVLRISRRVFWLIALLSPEYILVKHAADPRVKLCLLHVGLAGF